MTTCSLGKRLFATFGMCSRLSTGHFSIQTTGKRSHREADRLVIAAEAIYCIKGKGLRGRKIGGGGSAFYPIPPYIAGAAESRGKDSDTYFSLLKRGGGIEKLFCTVLSLGQSEVSQWHLKVFPPPQPDQTKAKFCEPRSFATSGKKDDLQSLPFTPPNFRSGHCGKEPPFGNPCIALILPCRQDGCLTHVLLELVLQED